MTLFPRNFRILTIASPMMELRARPTWGDAFGFTLVCSTRIFSFSFPWPYDDSNAFDSISLVNSFLSTKKFT